jgi:hypothetical protein
VKGKTGNCGQSRRSSSLPPASKLGVLVSCCKHVAKRVGSEASVRISRANLNSRVINSSPPSPCMSCSTRSATHSQHPSGRAQRGCVRNPFCYKFSNPSGGETQSCSFRSSHYLARANICCLCVTHTHTARSGPCERASPSSIVILLPHVGL